MNVEQQKDLQIESVLCQPLIDRPSPSAPRSRRVSRRFLVVVYGLWLLCLPFIGPSTDGHPDPRSMDSPISIEVTESEGSKIMVGRRRSLLRGLRTLAGA